MSIEATRPDEEGITFFGHSPSEILSAFHRSGLSSNGFSIAGRIVPQVAHMVGQGVEDQALFDGQKLYAGTFIKRS